MSTGNPLDHSRPIRWDHILMDPDGHPFLDHLEAHLEAREVRQRARKPEDQRRFRATLEALVLELLVAAWHDPALWLAYSRRREDYPGNSRYHSPLITYRAVIDLVDLLVEAGLAEGERGFFDRSHHGGMVKVGRQSRIRATASLVGLAAEHGFTGASITTAPSSETILLRAPKVDRNRPGRLVEYQDTDETIGLRSTLGRINAVLAAKRIELPDAGEVQPDAVAEEPPNGEPLPIDRTSHRVYRVFNDGRFDRGGRFYCWWQTLRKEDRRRLLIDGEPVIELDFAGMHPRLCYALDGQPLAPEVDPYAIPGLEGTVLRDLAKRGYNQLLNGTKATYKAPPGCAGRLPPGMTWNQLLQQIEAHHRPIAHWLRCQRGLELQAIDAGIAEQVLSFLAYRGIPCLPVHDSFILARRHEEVLGETMMLAWHGQIRKHGGEPGVAPIKGWSSPDLAQRVTLRVAA